MSRTVAILAAVLSLASPSPAAAQAVPEEGLSTTGADAVDHEQCEGEACWARKRKVQVVQSRPFSKNGRLEAGILGGVIPNDPFVAYGATGLRLSYYVSESLAVGATAVLPFLSETLLGDDIFADYPNIDSRRNLHQRLFYHVNILEWTPLVGKMAFYSAGTVHFDLGISAGFGLLHTEAPAEDLSGDVTLLEEDRDLKFLFSTGGGLRFYLGEWLALRIDGGQYFYQKPLGGLSHPTMISLGVSTFLPSLGRGR